MDCKRHKYRRVNAARATYPDGSFIQPTVEQCAKCGKVKRGSFDF